MVMKIMLVMMKIDAQASKIERQRRWMPFCEFPLQIPSRGEASVIFGCAVCRLPDPISRGETIWGGGPDGNYTATTIRADQIDPAV